MKKTFNILFVCRHNRFRSRFAELYLKKINKNKNVQVKSAGIFPGGWPLNKLEVKEAKKFGVKLKGRPKPVTTELLNWNDLIILITDDVPNPKKLFNYATFKNDVVVWEIKDSDWESTNQMEEIIKKIIINVEELNKKIENIK